VPLVRLDDGDHAAAVLDAVQRGAKQFSSLLRAV
jgi:hypothetical protein